MTSKKKAQIVSISFLPLMVDLGRLGIEFDEFEELTENQYIAILDDFLGDLKVGKIELISKK
jgi:hypothetical protein